ncbi:hypothetical protein [Iningainema tapete]|uniref:NAD/NADP transhydrogenase beta subunit n=1 Tax=Iningainema tapete BLCC-T55 TaxID=2748662 RepID=A0A8J6XP60_9CYAN|nr:hypothetical protein [Iningainema tapete]MBD2775555.1 hypothetical protein [Iningainema tapete BLCC-T55]
MWLNSSDMFAQIGVNEIINNGAATARSIASSWNQQWLSLLQNDTNNNIYGALTNLGVFFAVGTLLFFMIQWLRDVLDGEYSRPISALIWPFVVVLLLTNSGQGTMLSSLTLGVRDLLNGVNQQVVDAGNIEQNYQQALNMSIAEEVAGSYLRPCQSLTGQQQADCLIIARDKINELWDEYRSLYGDRPWITRLQNQVVLYSENTGNVPEIAFNSFLGSTVQTSIKTFFISLQFAFQNLLESAMLLVAVLGPLAVGGSLLPVAGKPIFAWLTGFLSVGIAKISFNIIAIVTATVIVNGPAQDANATNPDLMWFIIFLGLLAPILSLALAAAGGFAVFNAISNTASWVRARV